ncbi:MAG: hypothetical protein IKS14_07305 [Thermoguttaceae bacterium]|nr:hypothetical protein [Thermoguttaceae bacterium]
MVLGVEADYSLAPSLEVIAEVNNALYKLAENYGDLGTIDRIAFAKSIGGVIAHEFGHAFVQYLRKTDQNAQARLDYAEKIGKLLLKRNKLVLSDYSKTDPDEFIGEVFSKLFEEPQTRHIVKYRESI